MSDERRSASPDAPLVFNEEWLAPLHGHFSGRHTYQTTYIYRVATLSVFASHRREIESWVAQLPIRERKMLIPKLRSSENHDQTYHELAVGALMREAGLSVSYEERVVGGISPDWVIRDACGQRSMVIEVLTANPSSDQASWQRAVEEVLARLDEVPAGLAVGIDAGDADWPPDQQHLKRIETAVRRWVAAGLPPVGTSIEVEGVRLLALAQSPDWSGVQAAGFARAFRPDYAGLARRISDKVSRYGDAASDLRIPLVVAVVVNSSTGLDAECIDSVLNGRPTYECLFDRSSGKILGNRFTGRKDALFSMTPRLSAVFHARRDSGTWRADVLRNAAALTPLRWECPAEWCLKTDQHG